MPAPRGWRICRRHGDVLDLYAEPYDPARPVVCLDEKPVTLHADVSPSLSVRPGAPARSDYEYVRCGTANLFVCIEPLRGYRHLAVTDRRTKQDYTQVIKWLVDDAYPEVEVIRLVQDNLNTHLPGSPYDAFEAAGARRLLWKLEFRYTPVRGSRLNFIEIEIAVIGRECLRRRAGDRATLEKQVAALRADRNQQQRTITWSFTAYDARTKLRRLYPIPQS
ncbi:MAG: transposase [Chloroflexota bacterium]|nr:transposase [Chloroflexota bacterium]